MRQHVNPGSISGEATRPLTQIVAPYTWISLSNASIGIQSIKPERRSSGDPPPPALENLNVSCPIRRRAILASKPQSQRIRSPRVGSTHPRTGLY